MDSDETEDGNVMTGDEDRMLDSTSSCLGDLLSSGKRGERGGEQDWRLSLGEVDRLRLALELAVGFM